MFDYVRCIYYVQDNGEGHINCTGQDCQDVFNAGCTSSGKYTIQPAEWPGCPFQVYCNMTDFAVESGHAGCEGGGWTVSRLDQGVEPDTLKYLLLLLLFFLHLFRLHVNTVNFDNMYSGPAFNINNTNFITQFLII